VKGTDRYALPYPEDEDFADGSTQLAALATAIDAEIQTRINAYTALLKPSAYIRGLTAGVNFTNSSQFQIITWDTDIYSSGSLNPTVTSDLLVPSSGVYQAGMFCFLTTVGAVTANSIRNFKLEYHDRRGSSLSDEVDLDWQQTTLEAATGVGVTLHAVFPVYTPGISGGGLRGYIQHSNTASQMQLQASSFIWINRLGDLVV
jgi:hypothetical protein